ncbi:MAG: SIR2 family protein, partial [Phycisphaeraceae bacterium]|nr:SIR2 family protein [Phycisphaeraceae bacterium]
MSTPCTVLRFEDFTRHVVDTLHRHPHQPGAAYTLLLGSGFSYPLVPTARDMVLRDIPWWLHWQKLDEKARKKHHPEARFPDAPKSADCPELDTFAKELWARVHQQCQPHEHLRFELNPDTGLPKPQGDNIGNAYRAVMSSYATAGFGTPKAQRQYLRDVVRRIGNRINMAHLILASFFDMQKRWTDKQAFCRTIFTTNFDTLIQRSLQLVCQLYVLTDRPEVGIDAPDDELDAAIHLIHTHGSIYRYFLANTPADLDRLQKQNASGLVPYFERHGVIVMGYSGWQDTTMTALLSCKQFDNNLYWCDMPSAADAPNVLREDVKELLATDPEHRFYVPLPSKGADAGMVELHRALAGTPCPDFLFDPLRGLIESVESIDAPDYHLCEQSAAGVKSSGDSISEQSLRNDSTPRQIRDRTIEILKTVRERDFQVGKTTSSEPAKIPDISTAVVNVDAVMNQALQAALKGKLDQAIALWTQVADASETSPAVKAKALFNRGVTKGQSGDAAGEIADYDALLAMHDAPAELRATALFNRGLAKGQSNNTAGEIADYDALLAMPDAPAQQRANALVNRGVTKCKSGDAAGAIADYDALLAMPDAPAEQRAKALVNRGVAKGQSGDAAGEIADYDALLA